MSLTKWNIHVKPSGKGKKASRPFARVDQNIIVLNTCASVGLEAGQRVDLADDGKGSFAIFPSVEGAYRLCKASASRSHILGIACTDFIATHELAGKYPLTREGSIFTWKK